MNKSNDPNLKSWVKVARESDFPIQNLPFGIFKNHDFTGAGVAIGDCVVDLAYLHDRGYLKSLDLPKGIFGRPVLNDFFALGRKRCGEVRSRISELLRADNTELQSKKADKEAA